METEFRPQNHIDILEEKLKKLDEIVLKDWYLMPNVKKEGEELSKRAHDSLAFSRMKNRIVDTGIYDTKRLIAEIELFKDKAIKHITKERESH